MADIFLIAPADADAEGFARTLASLLDRMPAAALLLPRGAHSENGYKALVKAVLPVAQGKDVAVIIEGTPGEVRKLGADGLHVTGGSDEVREAMVALKPDFIVGAAALLSMDDAMSKGELGVDYVFFGPLSGSIAPAARELAHWWAETMEVPSVLSDPEATDPDGESEGCEFIALGERLWQTAP
jgi:thiamine-phosphate pyrophosphorylase